MDVFRTGSLYICILIHQKREGRRDSEEVQSKQLVLMLEMVQQLYVSLLLHSIVRNPSYGHT